MRETGAMLQHYLKKSINCLPKYSYKNKTSNEFHLYLYVGELILAPANAARLQVVILKTGAILDTFCHRREGVKI